MTPTPVPMTKKKLAELKQIAIGAAGKDVSAHGSILFLLVSAHVGTNAEDIAKASRLPLEKCVTWSKEARASRIFRGRRVYANWNDPEDGYISLIADSAAIDGLLRRVG